MLFDVYLVNAVGVRKWVGHVGAEGPERALQKACDSYGRGGHDVAIVPSAAAARRRKKFTRRRSKCAPTVGIIPRQYDSANCIPSSGR